MTQKGSAWGDPVNLGPKVNSGKDENQPFLSSNGQEPWFTGDSQLGGIQDLPPSAAFFSRMGAGGLRRRSCHGLRASRT